MALKFGKKLKNIIGTVAPMLGGALGGPLGGLAGRMVQDALGVDSEAAAIAQLESDPDALLKLKQAEIAFDERMRELDIEETKLHADDRSDARLLGREKGTGFQMILSGLFLVGYFSLIYFFFTGRITSDLGEWERGQLGILIGILTAAIPQILAYWFGSSSGSKQKTDALITNGAH